MQDKNGDQMQGAECMQKYIMYVFENDGPSSSGATSRIDSWRGTKMVLLLSNQHLHQLMLQLRGCETEGWQAVLGVVCAEASSQKLFSVGGRAGSCRERILHRWCFIPEEYFAIFSFPLFLNLHNFVL